MKNPVILGVAATNRPHVRLREHPMEVVEVDGKKMIRVPFMVKGKYRHPMGSLDFTDAVFDKMIQNHQAKAGDFAEGLDVKHIPDLGSLAWFDPDKGGRIVKEGNLLVGYGVPTGEDAIGIVESGKFRYSSVEFHPDYKSNLERTYLEETSIDTVDLTEVIALGNINRDAFGRWATKVGGAVKKAAGKMKANYKKGQEEAAEMAAKHGDSKKEWQATKDRVKGVAKKVKTHAKEFGGGMKEGAKDAFSWKGEKKFNDRQANTKSKMRKAGQMAGYIGAPAAIAAGGLYVASKLEAAPLDLQPTLVKQALATYIQTGNPEDYLWLDPQSFDLAELNLPVENDHYKVDKQTAEEMLAVLDELAQAQPALFYTEEEMETLDEALARIEELETELETLRAGEPEMTEREKALQLRLEALERDSTEKTVRLEIETARSYRDGDGRGHSAVVLNFISDLMLGKPLNDGEIKLESYTDPAAIAKYFRDGLGLFLKTAPGTQPAEGKTSPDETRTLETAAPDLYEAGKQAGKSFWGKN